jgi:hypothetical protein
MTLSPQGKRILEVLHRTRELKAREIAKRCSLDKTEVNSRLYGELHGDVIRDELFRWSIRDATIVRADDQAALVFPTAQPRRRFVDRFLDARQLKFADGRPLYAYRCTEAEFTELQSVLDDAAAAEDALTGFGDRFGPMFVLFASEWWRRHHKGGPWKWEPIFDAVGLGVRGIQDVYTAVQRGLQFWRRKPLVGGQGRLFLVTLACEGGLPLQLVRNDSGRLKTFFRKLLEDYGTFARSGIAAVDLARRDASELPLQLRQEVVFELGARLVEQIWDLQSKVPGAADPIAALDRIDSKWRDQLPLEVTDSVLEAFLRNLVATAAQIREHGSAELKLVRYIRKQFDRLELTAELSIPPSVTAAEFALLFGLEEASLPTRGEVLLTNLAGDTRCVAVTTIFQRDDQSQCRIERLSAGGRITGAAAQDGWRIRFDSGRVSSESRNLRGGEPLSPDLPWIFGEQEPGRYRFIGQGSVRTRFPRCLVVLPSDVTPPDGVGRIAELGVRAAYVVEHEISLRSAEGSIFRIRPGEEREDASEAAIAGDLFRASADEREIFLGAPTVYRVLADGRQKPVPINELLWRTVGTTEWHRWDAPFPLGRVTVRIVSGDETQFQRTIDIVPADLRIILTPRSLQEGSIEFRSNTPFSAAVTVPEGCAATAEANSPGQTRFTVRCDRRSPSAFSVSLSLGSGRSVKLSVPFPIRGARFVTTGDHVLRHESVVRPTELAAIRAEAFGQSDFDAFAVEGLLTARAMADDANVGFQFPLQRASVGRHLLDLRRIGMAVRNLLSQTEDLDARVDLRLLGPNVGPSRVAVQRFDKEFRIDDDEIAVVDNLSHCPIGSQYCVEAIRLWDPATDLVTLPYDENRGRWLLHLPDEPGPWLLIGGRDGEKTIRPRVAYVPGDAPSRSPIQFAIMKSRDEAAPAIVSELQRLASSPLSEDWSVVMGSLAVAKLVPPATLLVCSGLSQAPRAAVTALCLAMTDRQAVWDTLEELPFEWYLVPISDWFTAIMSWRSALDDLSPGLGGSSVNDLLDFLKSSAERRHMRPFFELVAGAAGVMRRDSGADSSDEGIDSLVDAQQALIVTHDGKRWPNGETIRRRVDDVRGRLGNHLPQSLRNEMPRHRVPVLWSPFVAADIAISGSPVSSDTLLEIRSTRRFDPNYFDRAYGAALKLMLPPVMGH